MKAYRRKDGKIQLFRPDENAKRMRKSCERLLMPSFHEDKFVEAVKQVVATNEAWVPPYESGSTLYIRPYMIGVGDNIGVAPRNRISIFDFCFTSWPIFQRRVSSDQLYRIGL